MSETLDRLNKIFEESIEAKIETANTVLTSINYACDLMVEAISNGNKILVCSSGIASANAQYFVANMVNNFQVERPSLPAISLNANSITLNSITNSDDYSEIFSKQITALAQEEDILFAIINNDKYGNISTSIDTAQSLGLKIILLSGNNSQSLCNLLREEDIAIVIPNDNISRVQENHLLTIHSLCNIIDNKLFAEF